MGHRLTKLVTRTGDDGTTGLGDGTRVAKDSARIEAMGAVDELNSTLGVLLALPLPKVPPTRALLTAIQHQLFDLGGELAVPGTAQISHRRVATLERHIAQLNASLPALKEFLLPGGGAAAAACHFARTVCRRAERRCWALAHTAGIPATAKAANTLAVTTAWSPTALISAAALRYLNRLSDLLFVLARIYARADGGSEVQWRHIRGRKSNAAKAARP